MSTLSECIAMECLAMQQSDKTALYMADYLNAYYSQSLTSNDVLMICHKNSIPKPQEEEQPGECRLTLKE